MKIERYDLIITRDGYVKDEDELVKHMEDATMILDAHLRAALEELDQAGYCLQIRTERTRQ